MTAAYVSRQISETSSSVTSRTITKPTSTASGDLLIAAICVRANNDGLFTFPSDWVLIADLWNSTITYMLAYKVAGGSEPADYTFSWTNAGRCQSLIARFTGADTTNPINVASMVNDSATPYTHPDITTTVDDCLILRAIGWQGNPTVTIAGADIWTEQEGASAGEGQGCGTEVLASAGATGTADTTGPSAANLVATVAIAPPAAVGGAGPIFNGRAIGRGRILGGSSLAC